MITNTNLHSTNAMEDGNQYRLQFEYLETDRLQLRKLTPFSIQTIFATLPDDELKAFFGIDNDHELEKEKQKVNNGLSTHNRSLVWFQMLLKSTGEMIGSIGFHNWMPEHSRAELGYSLLDDTWKQQGYMKEAFPQVLAYGFRTMGLVRVEAFVSPVNEASIRLLKAWHFVEEGLMREHYQKNGVHEDSMVFSLLKREYESVLIEKQ